MHVSGAATYLHYTTSHVSGNQGKKEMVDIYLQIGSRVVAAGIYVVRPPSALMRVIRVPRGIMTAC